MPRPTYTETDRNIYIGFPPEEPVVQAPALPQQAPQQQPEPADPVDFFHVGPGTPADDPLYEQARADWYKDFVNGYYQQNFRNVNDYVEFVQRLGSNPGIDAYAKKQALRHMPPKVKEDMARIEAEKQAKQALFDTFDMAQEMNAELERRGANMIAQIDEKGSIKYTPLKVDPKANKWHKQIELAQKGIDTIVKTVKGPEASLSKKDTEFLEEQKEIIRRAFKELRMGDPASEYIPEDYTAIPGGIRTRTGEVITDTEALRAFRKKQPWSQQQGPMKSTDSDIHMQAVLWAQQNPSDPRAQQILALRGGGQ